MKNIVTSLLLVVVLLSGCKEEVPPTPPVISSVEPAKGTVGTLVTIRGGNFGEEPSVTINGTQTQLNLVADDKIMVTILEGTSTGKIKVNNGGAEAETSDDFEMIFVPTITAFSPASGKRDEEVTIDGTNFTADTEVYFNVTKAVQVSKTATRIVARVPAQASPGKIKLTNLAGTGESATAFGANPPSVKTSVTVVGIGQMIYFEVANFGSIGFNGVTSHSVQFDGKDLLDIYKTVFTCDGCYTGIIPPGVKTGKLSVVVNGYSVPNEQVITVPGGGQWVSGIPFPSYLIINPASFRIGDDFFYGIGTAKTFYSTSLTQEFWKFNIPTGQWAKVKSFIGSNPSGDPTGQNTFSFAVNGKGYVSGGGSPTSFDLCEYDPVSDNWSKKTPLNSTLAASGQQFGFSSTQKGYVISRQGVVTEYDPGGDAWTVKSTVPTALPKPLTISAGVSFNGKEYLFLTDNARSKIEMWEYDMAGDSWNQKADCTASPYGAFEIEGKIYAVGEGMARYDFGTNSWTFMQSPPRSITYGGFSSGKIGYGMSVIVDRVNERNHNTLHRFQAD